MGYGTVHEMLIEEQKDGSYIILQDEYDDSDMTEIPHDYPSKKCYTRYGCYFKILQGITSFITSLKSLFMNLSLFLQCIAIYLQFNQYIL